MGNAIIIYDDDSLESAIETLQNTIMVIEGGDTKKIKEGK